MNFAWCAQRSSRRAGRVPRLEQRRQQSAPGRLRRPPAASACQAACTRHSRRGGRVAASRSRALDRRRQGRRCMHLRVADQLGLERPSSVRARRPAGSSSPRRQSPTACVEVPGQAERPAPDRAIRDALVRVKRPARRRRRAARPRSGRTWAASTSPSCGPTSASTARSGGGSASARRRNVGGALRGAAAGRRARRRLAGSRPSPRRAAGSACSRCSATVSGSAPLGGQHPAARPCQQRPLAGRQARRTARRPRAGAPARSSPAPVEQPRRAQQVGQPRRASAGRARRARAAWRSGAPRPSTAKARASVRSRRRAVGTAAARRCGPPAPGRTCSAWRRPRRSARPARPAAGRAARRAGTGSRRWRRGRRARSRARPPGSRSATTTRPRPGRAAGGAPAAPVQPPAVRPALAAQRPARRSALRTDAQAQVGQLAGQLHQPAQRRRVGPVHVVDHQQGRRRARPARRPARSARKPRRAWRRRRAPGRPDRRRSDRRASAAAPTASAVPLRPARSRGEQLAGDAPAGLLLQRAGPGAQHPRPRSPARVRADRAQQARLADAGRPLDDDHPARPVAYLLSCRPSAASSASRWQQRIRAHTPTGPRPGARPSSSVRKLVVALHDSRGSARDQHGRQDAIGGSR